MRRRPAISIVAAIALLFSCAPLTVVYTGLFEWAIPAVALTATMVGTAIGVRALRGNPILQVLGMMAVALLMCTWMFRSGGELLGILPSGDTFSHFGALLSAAGTDVREQTLPVDTTDGLVFMLMLGVIAMVLLTEVFVAIVQIPAMVGIPLLTMYLVPMVLLPQSVPWPLFVPGAVGYLWLLMSDNIDRVRRYGRRFTGDGRGIDRWEPSPLGTTGRWMVLVLVPVALLLPAAIPGVTTGVLDSWYNGGGPGSGDGETTTVDPVAELEGQLSTPKTIELGYVQTEAPDPGYMRMWTASNLSDKGFTADTRVPDNGMPPSDINTSGLAPDASGTEYDATFTSTGLKSAALPLFGTPSSVDVQGDWVFDPAAGTVVSGSDDTEDLTFSYRFLDYDLTPDQLREADPVPTSAESYQRNTAHPDSRVVSDLVTELTANERTAYDKVLAIHRHFSRDNGFRYELTTGDGGEDASSSAIEKFLTTGKAGYCQQYAASMAWMVRDAGIPARVAIGLTGGTASSQGFRLTNYNFHAWVEVYFSGFGWVPFDPTPSSGVRNSEASEWAPDPNADNDEDDGSGNGGDSGNDGTDGGGSGNDPKPGEEDGTPGGSTSVVAWDGRQPPVIWPYWVAGGAVVLILLFLPAVVRQNRRHRRLAVPPGSPVEAATRAWEELVDLFTDHRLTVDPASTSRRLAEDVIEKRSFPGPAASGIRHLAAALDHSRYAPRPPSGMSLRAAIQLVQDGLSNSASIRERIRATLLPASVLASWRRGVSRIVHGGGDATVRARLRLRRLVRRRRPHQS